MTEFLLVLYLRWGYGGGLTSLRVATIEECEEIGQAMTEEFRGLGRKKLYRCFEVQPLASN